jgi:hypothetical protein
MLSMGKLTASGTGTIMYKTEGLTMFYGESSLNVDEKSRAGIKR